MPKESQIMIAYEYTQQNYLSLGYHISLGGSKILSQTVCISKVLNYIIIVKSVDIV